MLSQSEENSCVEYNCRVQLTASSVSSPTILPPQEILTNVLSKCEVPTHYFFASMAIGALFSASELGQFVVDMSGRAFLAANIMVEEAIETHPCGSIVVSDAVCQVGGWGRMCVWGMKRE